VTSPGHANGEGKVKDAVVNVLRSEWPLSLKEIYFATVKQHCLNVSYQAVHKALKQLIESRIVVKQGRKYYLNIKWIRQGRGFYENLEKAYDRPVKEEVPCRISDLNKWRADPKNTKQTLLMQQNKPG